MPTTSGDSQGKRLRWWPWGPGVAGASLLFYPLVFQAANSPSRSGSWVMEQEFAKAKFLRAGCWVGA